MIDIATMMVSVLGQEAFKRLLKSFQGNKTQLQRAYDRAFENTVRWYEKKYGDTYGSKNKRFFDYEPTERELAKLLLLRPKPDLKLISQIKLEEGKTTPAKVVREFVDKLRQEMGQIRECEELLVEREKFLELKKIADHTAPIPEYLPGIASDLHEMKEALVAPKKEAVKTSAKPLDWQQL
ncbi:MAG: hypothetical protein ONB05_02050, partial [candidate division KSB1 bacterium]|nr:hypothetical protein [candidate division KSB1 bacterium]